LCACAPAPHTPHKPTNQPSPSSRPAMQSCHGAKAKIKPFSLTSYTSNSSSSLSLSHGQP
jgi:hypothetical protein